MMGLVLLVAGIRSIYLGINLYIDRMCEDRQQAELARLAREELSALRLAKFDLQLRVDQAEYDARALRDGVAAARRWHLENLCSRMPWKVGP